MEKREFKERGRENVANGDRNGKTYRQWEHRGREIEREKLKRETERNRKKRESKMWAEERLMETKEWDADSKLQKCFAFMVNPKSSSCASVLTFNHRHENKENSRIMV